MPHVVPQPAKKARTARLSTQNTQTKRSVASTKKVLASANPKARSLKQNLLPASKGFEKVRHFVVALSSSSRLPAKRRPPRSMLPPPSVRPASTAGLPVCPMALLQAAFDVQSLSYETPSCEDLHEMSCFLTSSVTQ